jgi:hypothetical protein
MTVTERNYKFSEIITSILTKRAVIMKIQYIIYPSTDADQRPDRLLRGKVQEYFFLNDIKKGTRLQGSCKKYTTK